jgi:hypothetical protein
MFSYVPPRFPDPISPPNLSNAATAPQRNVPLKWTFKQSDESQIGGFLVLRADDKGGFKPISGLLPAHVRYFEDKSISNKEDVSAVYKLAVIDRIDTLAFSLPLPVFHPAIISPPIPRNFRGTVVKEETHYAVNLTWDSKSNNEDPTEEYILHGNSPPSRDIRPFQNIAPIKAAHYLFSIYNTLGDEYLFRLSGRSKSKAESKLSDTLKVYVPGNYVLSPSLMPVKVDSNTITLNWQHDYRKDLKGFCVMVNGVAVASEDKIGSKASSYSLRLEYGKTYVVEMIAVNRFGLKSEPSFKRLVTLERKR